MNIIKSLLCVFLFTSCSVIKPKPIITEYKIEKPIEEVWFKLMDFEKYPTWNPFIQHIKGNAIVGETLKVKIGLGDKPMNFKPTVLKVDNESEFRWKGKVLFRGLFDGEHYFKLTQLDDGSTLLEQGEHFSGLFSGLLLLFIRKSTIEGFNSMNQSIAQ